nr:hypothetical protein EVB34_056 [Rhizobium phage RHph_TM26]
MAKQIVAANSGVMAFGMSITTGALSLNTVNEWVNRFGQFIGGPVSNYAIGGTGLPSMASQANLYAPYGGRTQVAVVDGPLNDVRQAGPGCLPSIKPALDSMLSVLFSGYFRGAAWPAPNVVRAGAWSSLGTSFGGRSPYFSSNSPMQTVDPNASITFQFSGDTVFLHGFASETDDWLDMDIEIDGVPRGSTDWAFTARPGAGKQAVAAAFDGCGAGAHTIKVKAPSVIPAGRKCVIDGIQTPNKAAPLLLGGVPNIPNWAAYGATGTWADAQACNAIIEQVAGEWEARGYPVGYVPIENIRSWNPDGVHPVDRGHLNWTLCYFGGIVIGP